MKKQRIAAVVLVGVMLLSMTGCGNSKAKTYSKYVELGEYKGIEYTKVVTEVTDEDIQSKLDSFTEGLAESEEVTGRAVEDGDIANIDFVGTKDGEEFDGGTGEGYDLTIGSNTFIDGFESGLIGHEIGEEVSLDLTFPEDYRDEELAGQDVNFAVTINSISVKTTPELTDDLVKENTDYDTIDAYKESIREEMEESNEQSAEQQAQSDIFNKVIENCTITGYDEAEVTQLVDDEFDSFKQTAQTYEAYGYSYEDVLAANGFETEDDLKEGITEYVKNYLDQKMVLYCIAAEEGITVTSEETDELVQEYMDTYQVETKEEVYDYLGDDYFEVRVLSEKVMDFLMENAVLVDSTEETTEESSEDTEKDTESTEEESDDQADGTEEKSDDQTDDTEEETTEEETTEEDTTEEE